MKAKDMVVGIFFIFLLGSLFHFTYELSNNNIIVGLFSSTNESVFEHCKLFIYPIIIWYLIYYLKNINNINKNVLFSSMIINIITSIISLIIMYYTLKGIFGNVPLIVDILLFLLSIIIGYNIAYNNYQKGKRLPWLLLLILLIITFTYYSFNPLDIPFFRP